MNRVICGVLLMALLLPTSAAAQWKPHTVTDHLRGDVGKGVSAIGDLEDDYGKRSAELTINCSQNSTTVVMGRKGLYFGHDSVKVEYTVNGGPVQTARWNVCKSSDCVGLWGGAGIPFVKALYDKVLLRVTIHRSFAKSVYGSFAVAGTKEAVADLAKACKWG